MPVRIVKLGTARAADEGTRIGTVRRPPRGVPKSEFATGNWYDVWYPNLAPSVETMKLGQAATSDAQWQAFAKAFRREMKAPEASRSIELLAVMSRQAQFFPGLLLRERGPLPSRRPQGATGGSGRRVRCRLNDGPSRMTARAGDGERPESPCLVAVAMPRTPGLTLESLIPWK